MTLWMLATLLVSTLFAICAAVGDRIAARFAVPRRFVWIGALIAGSVLPLVTGLGSTALSLTRAPSALRRDETPRQARSAWSAGNLPATLLPLDAASWRARVRRATSIAQRADGWLFAVWVASSLTMLIWLLIRLAMLHRERRGWVLTNELGDPLFVGASTGPAAVGVLRPRIVIPRWLLDEDPRARALLLRHEAEHVRAGDTRVLFGAALLEVVFPWNAAMWWMARRLRLAIEIDCDQRVISAVGGVRQYGLALLAASERYAAPVPIAACLQESPLQIEARIHAMTQRRSHRPVTGTVLLVGLVGLAVAVSGWMPRPSLRSTQIPGVVGPDGAAVRAIREFIAAYNDPDTTRIMELSATAFGHGPANAEPVGDTRFIQWHRESGDLRLERIVSKSEWHAEYVVTAQSTDKVYVGYVMVSGHRPDWIEHFAMHTLPPGRSLEDPDVQSGLYPDAPTAGPFRQGFEDLQHWLRGGFRP